MSVLSAIGICERCRVESGGVYFLIAHALGSRFGGSLGLLYCFGQAVGCALNVLGTVWPILLCVLISKDSEFIMCSHL